MARILALAALSVVTLGLVAALVVQRGAPLP